MTSATTLTLDLDLDTVDDLDAAGTAAADQQQAVAAHRARVLESIHRRDAKLERWGWALLVAGLAVSLSIFGLVAYTHSVSQMGTQTAVSTTP